MVPFLIEQCTHTKLVKTFQGIDMDDMELVYSRLLLKNTMHCAGETIFIPYW